MSRVRTNNNAFVLSQASLFVIILKVSLGTNMFLLCLNIKLTEYVLYYSCFEGYLDTLHRHGIIISFPIIFNVLDKRNGVFKYVQGMPFQGLVKVMCQLHIVNEYDA